MNVELEHGLHDPRTNVSDDGAYVTAKNALAHLTSSPTTRVRVRVLRLAARV